MQISVKLHSNQSCKSLRFSIWASSYICTCLENGVRTEEWVRFGERYRESNTWERRQNKSSLIRTIYEEEKKLWFLIQSWTKCSCWIQIYKFKPWSILCSDARLPARRLSASCLMMIKERMERRSLMRRRDKHAVCVLFVHSRVPRSNVQEEYLNMFSLKCRTKRAMWGTFLTTIKGLNVF